MRPLAIDLYCGLGGWAEGFLSEGFRVIGFDIERHDYGTGGYPGSLVLQDVTTLHGSQFKDAAVIVASPPCQGYSYRAMPWSRAKALPPPDNTLFEACFRIQREACEAAGRHIPLIVENVRGAQKWVGRAKWHFGSYYLWGDLPALMPVARILKQPGRNFHFPEKYGIPSPSFHGAATETSVVNALRLRGDGIKVESITGYSRDHEAAFGWPKPSTGSKSSARKAASAAIAKIPFPLAQHIARCFKSVAP